MLVALADMTGINIKGTMRVKNDIVMKFATTTPRSLGSDCHSQGTQEGRLRPRHPVPLVGTSLILLRARMEHPRVYLW